MTSVLNFDLDELNSVSSDFKFLDIESLLQSEHFLFIESYALELRKVMLHYALDDSTKANYDGFLAHIHKLNVFKNFDLARVLDKSVDMPGFSNSLSFASVLKSLLSSPQSNTFASVKILCKQCADAEEKCGFVRAIERFLILILVALPETMTHLHEPLCDLVRALATEFHVKDKSVFFQQTCNFTGLVPNTTLLLSEFCKVIWSSFNTLSTQQQVEQQQPTTKTASAKKQPAPRKRVTESKNTSVKNNTNATENALSDNHVQEKTAFSHCHFGEQNISVSNKYPLLKVVFGIVQLLKKYKSNKVPNAQIPNPTIKKLHTQIHEKLGECLEKMEKFIQNGRLRNNSKIFGSLNLATIAVMVFAPLFPGIIPGHTFDADYNLLSKQYSDEELEKTIAHLVSAPSKEVEEQEEQMVKELEDLETFEYKNPKTITAFDLQSLRYHKDLWILVLFFLNANCFGKRKKSADDNSFFSAEDMTTFTNVLLRSVPEHMSVFKERLNVTIDKLKSINREGDGVLKSVPNALLIINSYFIKYLMGKIKQNNFDFEITLPEDKEIVYQFLCKITGYKPPRNAKRVKTGSDDSTAQNQQQISDDEAEQDQTSRDGFEIEPSSSIPTTPVVCHSPDLLFD